MPASHPTSEALNAPALKSRGLMLVLCAPPGGGKTTISREIMRLDPTTFVSVSATTRNMRPGEQDGVHYHFVDEAAFKKMVDDGDMLEHAFVYNNYHYGTPRGPVEEALAAGRDVLFDIDWQGARQLQAKAPDDVVSIFILPPSWAVLEDRLRGRGRDSNDDIDRRLSKAADEISHYDEFEYVIVNNALEDSIRAVRSIIEAERAKRRRLSGLQDLVGALKP